MSFDLDMDVVLFVVFGFLHGILTGSVAPTALCAGTGSAASVAMDARIIVIMRGINVIFFASAQTHRHCGDDYDQDYDSDHFLKKSCFHSVFPFVKDDITIIS